MAGPRLGTAGDFALRDGDTVVFLGDSITAARGYGKVIEDYTLLRYPERKVRFINAGQGGDTAEGGLKRLDRDVFSQGATVLTVAYGINDIGWGMKADAEHKQRYLKAIRGIVEQCHQHGVRVFICSPAITAEDPNRSENGFLQMMADEGMAVAQSLGEGAIDVQRGMREIQRRIWAANARESDPKRKTSLHAEDGIHLSDLGHLAMAYAMLKGLGAQAEVSSVALDVREPNGVAAEGCRVTDVQWRDGVNISSMTADAWEPGGPWDAQAGVVKELTEARDRLTAGNLLRSQFLPEHPQRDALSRQFAATDERLVSLQREVAQPFPYHFEIRPHLAAPKP